jgi:nitrite reductase (NO-forming)
MKMKHTILAGIFASILVAGFVFYPLLVGSSQSAKAMNVEFTPSGVNKHVTLVTNETVVQVAPDNALHPGGIEYNAYTFNGTIPGPAIAIDQGDNLTVTLQNDGKLIHSVDFHAGIGDTHVNSGPVEPGQSHTWSLQGINGGAFMYHCAADALNGVWEHIANGMYGVIVVHPQNEEPAKEFYVAFGELYNSADQGLFKGTNGTVGSFDITKFATNQPDLVLTNGMAHKYAPAVGSVSKLELNPNATLFYAKPGELTRWFIVDGGPNDGVAFHFISGQMDVRDGFNQQANSYGTVLMNDETWWVPPGSASVFETIFPEAGPYVAVDHSMVDVVKGAAFVVLAQDNSTATDIPEGAWVPPKGSEYVGGNQQAQWVAEYGGGEANQTATSDSNQTAT